MTTATTPARVYNSADLLSVSSSASIANTLRRMRRRFRGWNRWLTAKHPYTNVITVLESNPSALDGVKLAEYIAASMPLHVADGWTFLARAFDSVKSGDRNTAVHLAYYAELRAAMSLLAAEGVGVFHWRHVGIGQSFTPTIWNNGGTHQATWNLLESWADDATRVATLLAAVRVETRTIEEWFDEAKIGQSVQHLVARQWLRSWSIDLSYFPIDRDLRNQTSYRPSRISPASANPVDPASEVIDPLLRTWEALEPSSDSGGAAIDRALLYRALLSARVQDPSSASWSTFVDGLKGIASMGLEAQLRSPESNEFYVLRWADDSSIPPPVQAVLSRATLLLRIANGVCARRLADAQVTKQDLQFWWSGFGEDSGLWSGSTELDTFADLWGDVRDAIDDVEGSLSLSDPSHEMSEVNQLFGREPALTQFSRTPLWLLGVD